MSSALFYLSHPLAAIFLLVLVVLWTQLAHSFGGTPHFLVAHSLKLLVETVTIVGLRVAVDRNLSLVTSLN